MSFDLWPTVLVILARFFLNFLPKLPNCFAIEGVFLDLWCCCPWSTCSCSSSHSGRGTLTRSRNTARYPRCSAGSPSRIKPPMMSGSYSSWPQTNSGPGSTENWTFSRVWSASVTGIMATNKFYEKNRKRKGFSKKYLEAESHKIRVDYDLAW